MKAETGKWMILTGVILAMLLSSLDQTIVSTAMPTIVQELHGLEHISWVFTAYMLGSTVTVPIYGKLSDLFGRRNLYLIGIGIFLGGSVLCGMAQNMSELILFRALQGIGGGAMMVNSFAIIGDVFPPAERGRYQGMIGGVFGLSSIAGPLLGGWITDNTSWRWVFYVNIPLGVLAIIVLAAALPKIAAHQRDRRIDWFGAFFIVAALVPLLLSLVWGGSVYQWSSWPIISSLILAFVSIFLFIRTERRARNPIISLDLFKNSVFLVSVVVLFLTSMGMFGAIMYIPIFSQGVIGGSATHAGLILTPMMLSLVVASSVSGQIISRTGKYKTLAVIGTAVIVGALFYFSTVDEHTKNGGLIMRMVLLGLGLGSTMPIFTLAVQSAFGKERLGEVTAGTQLFRSIGGTVGTAVLGGIMNSRLSAQVAHMQNEPFVARLQQFNSGSNHINLDASLVQGVLNRENQQHMRDMLQSIPAYSRTLVTGQFNHFIASSKVAFSDAIQGVFLVAACLMLVAFIVVFFLPEIPLRRSNKPAVQETGTLLEDELGEGDDDCHTAAQAARQPGSEGSRPLQR
ncbi:MAG TPA: MDR family MFS transporter [Flavisolibacter sp.]|nr:MDR family MFS transporter [Flavisolibacter sp.]